MHQIRTLNCVLEIYKNCNDSTKPISVVGLARSKSFKYASEQLGDTLYLDFDLEEHAQIKVAHRPDLYVHTEFASS